MVAMPLPDEGVMARRSEIASALRRILPAASVVDAAPALRAYESDGLAAYRQPPLVVEGRAEDEARAFRVALPRLVAALDRQLSRRAVRPRKTLREPFARASSRSHDPRAA